MLRASRVLTTTYVYDDPAHPDRPTGAIAAPAWTGEDRDLLIALRLHEEELCPGGCGELRTVAWHQELDGWYESEPDDEWVCHACTAREGKQKVFARVRNTYPSDRLAALSPLEVGVNTTPPEDSQHT